MKFKATQLESLAMQHGTPLYVYSEQVIAEKYTALAKTLGSLNPLICFAMKANATLGILRLFSKLGCGFDIVSGGELHRVIKAGGDPKKVVFSGVAKSDEDIEFALKSKIKFFNVESEAELQLIEQIAKRLGVVAPVCLRINPNVDAKTHKHLTTGTKANKFGIAVPAAIALWEQYKNSPQLEFLGLDCHIGSQITEVQPIEDAYRAVLEVVAQCAERGLKVKTLDLGGGFGITYSGHYKELGLNALQDAVERVFKDAPFQFVFEPGRFLIAEAGALVTKVQYIKESGGKRFAIVDAGMNDLVRPAMYDSYHKIELVSDKPATGAEQEYDVVGPVCESSCYFAKERALPTLQRGDLLCINDAGAYGSVMGSNYNARVRPAEILIGSDGQATVIRRRETVEELWMLEA